MMNKVFPIFLLFFFSSSCLAQDRFSIAKEASNLFPDDEVAILESSINIEFKEDRSKGKIAVVRYDDEYIALQNKVKFYYTKFYDGESEITAFQSGAPADDDYYNSDGIFHSDVRVIYSAINLRDFAQIHETYSIKEYHDLRYLTSIYLTQPYPCLKRKIRIVIPEDMKVNLLQFNLEEFDISSKTEDGKKSVIYTYSGTNLESFTNEKDAPGNSYIYPHILFNIESYSESGKQKTLFSSTDDLYGWYSSLVDKIGNNKEPLRKQVEKLTAEAQSDKEKVESIFYWVQNNIRYIAFEDGIAGFKPENCQNVYKKKYGDCKGMANLMKQMLIIAGFDARLTWMGTKSLAYDYTTPSLAVDNHMICALKWEDDFIYLDATEEFINIDSYAERIQGQAVLIEDGTKYILKTIPISSHEKNKRTYELNLEVGAENKLEGNVEVKFSGEAKTSLMQYVKYTESNKKEEAIADFLSYGDNNIKITDIEEAGFDHKSTQGSLKGSIEMDEYVSEFGKELYVYLDPYKLYEQSEFRKERKFDYWMSYKKFETITVKLKIPSGFTLSSIPEPISFQNEDFKFNGKYKEDGQTIEYNFSVEIPDAKISVDNINSWNDFNSKLDEFYEQPLIFKQQ